MGYKISRSTGIRKNETLHNKNCPLMQIGGIKGNSCSEHLIVVKTWMKTKETGNTVCIFEAFNMEKFFDNEGLTDKLQKILTRGK